MGQVELAALTQCLKRRVVEVRQHRKTTLVTINKGNKQFKIFQSFYMAYIRRDHEVSLTKWFYLVGCLARGCQHPICHQLIGMQCYPRLNKLHLLVG